MKKLVLIISLLLISSNALALEKKETKIEEKKYLTKKDIDAMINYINRIPTEYGCELRSFIISKSEEK